MEKKENWIEEVKKQIRMKGHACRNCSNETLLIEFPMIYSEEESQGKKVVFGCSICKLKAIGSILNPTKIFWFYVTKDQKFII
jgi:hypothetical protein